MTATPTHNPTPAQACIALGSNLGDRQAYLQRALDAMPEHNINVLQVSAWLETEPVGGPQAQGAYLNGAAVVETALEPVELLRTLLKIEKGLGRERCKEERWGPRTIDLDVLLYRTRSLSQSARGQDGTGQDGIGKDAGQLQTLAYVDVVLDTSELTLPHPRLHERLFVLEPLVEVAPHWVHPGPGEVQGKTVAELVDALRV